MLRNGSTEHDAEPKAPRVKISRRYSRIILRSPTVWRNLDYSCHKCKSRIVFFLHIQVSYCSLWGFCVSTAHVVTRLITGNAKFVAWERTDKLLGMIWNVGHGFGDEVVLSILYNATLEAASAIQSDCSIAPVCYNWEAHASLPSSVCLHWHPQRRCNTLLSVIYYGYAA